MKITIEIDTLTPLYGPSWEKLQDVIRSCVSDDEPDIKLVTIERTDRGANYRGNGEFRIGLKQGEQNYAGIVRVENVRD